MTEQFPGQQKPKAPYSMLEIALFGCLIMILLAGAANFATLVQFP
jgi:hypothetical protein